MTPRDLVESVYRSDSRRVLATLIRLTGDFDLAEESMHDAFAAALEQWERDGVPANPCSWLISAGRFKAIDRLRRDRRRQSWTPDLLAQLEATPMTDPEAVEDDRLRLIFTCCHPALAIEAQTAMTLREVCGLTTEEIARAYLATPPTIAKRIVRAKTKIREARIPYQVPSGDQLNDRLYSVLQVIYLVFTEGYSASAGPKAIRVDLCREAIRLGRLLAELLPDPEVLGLLSLMLLQNSRGAARTSPDGDLIPLEDQDRSLWDRTSISEGLAFLSRATASGEVGVYTLQAAIAAVHARQTDWGEIVRLYDLLLKAAPSPVVELNRAVALGMRDGPAVGLAAVDAILPQLESFYLAHAARADMLRRLNQAEAARSSYVRALSLAKQEAVRQFLERRLHLCLENKSS